MSLLLDHYARPRNRGPLPGADVQASGGNPECGDYIIMYARVGADGRLERVTFEGEGSVLSIAAASYVSERVVGMTTEEVEALPYETLLEELGTDAVRGHLATVTLPLATLKQAMRSLRSGVRARHPATEG